MAETPPTGAPPDLIPSAKIPVIDLCRIAGCATTYYYREARLGRAPKSRCGLTFEEAKSWLDGRIAKRGAKAAAIQRLRELYEEAPDAKEARNA